VGEAGWGSCASGAEASVLLEWVGRADVASGLDVSDGGSDDARVENLGTSGCGKEDW